MAAAIVSGILDFNPRSREGSDKGWTTVSKFVGISIHAPAKGATYASSIDKQLNIISIHAPAKGATNLWLGINE